MATFDPCVTFTLKQEGGWVNNPKDPGGATNHGITIGVLSAWRGWDATPDDVRALTENEARAIYRHRYWMPIRGDDLPQALALVTFDAAVNSGVSRAANWLQQAVGADTDGSIGPQTIALCAKVDVPTAVAACCDARLAFLKSLKTWPVFGKGWGNRVAAVRAAALHMV